MLKEKVFLVLTPIRSTYPKNYEGTIIFLGNKDYDFLKKENPNAKIKKIKTLWIDKIKLKSDISYLSNFENTLFDQVIKILNKFFDVNYNTKYWSIFVRPTIFTILTVLYERWQTISFIKENYEITHCKFINIKDEDLIPCDVKDLDKKMYSQDFFNQYIFQKILENKEKKFEYIYNLNTSEKNIEIKKNLFFFYLKKIKLKNFFYLFRIIHNKLKNFILVKSIKGKNFTYISQYLDNKDLRVKLNSFFNQNNFIFEIKNAKSFSKVDKKSRNLLSKSFTFNGKNDFEKFIKKNLFNYLPKCFIENFKTIQKKSSHFVKNFKFNLGIITYDQVYSYNFSEMDWIAKNYMNGSKLILAQFGGGWLTPETGTISTMISKFNLNLLTFGIKNDVKQKHYGAGFFRFEKELNNFKKNGRILYALYTPYGYSGNVRSNAPISSEWISYMETHEKLIQNLDLKIQKEIILRPKKRLIDYYNYKDRLLKKFPNIEIDDYSKSLKERMRSSRLLIATNDTTTILEGLAINFPSILIYDLNKFRISPKYQEYYKNLQDAEIIFDTPERAKIHIENIFSDVESWWKNKNVQRAREEFCKKFAYHLDNQSNHFIDVMSKI